MNSRLFGVLAVVFLAASLCDSVQAQNIRRKATQRVPHYSRTQTISPYAQLFGRNNAGGVTNYFLEVRPRLQMQQQINQIEANNVRQFQQNQAQYLQQTQAVQQAILAQDGPLLTQRGTRAGRVSNSASFFNTRGYFNRFGSGAAGGGGNAAGR
ncbi:MAG: hypothetical protein KDB27_01570 [Planctomycetales bacterium]|nr:hypothetical protein [Planctomycetales bacterium]